MCKSCGSEDIEYAWRLRAKPMGSYSLAGMQSLLVAIGSLQRLRTRAGR